MEESRLVSEPAAWWQVELFTFQWQCVPVRKWFSPHVLNTICDTGRSVGLQYYYNTFARWRDGEGVSY